VIERSRGTKMLRGRDSSDANMGVMPSRREEGRRKRQKEKLIF
jgi:hypothetical protein